MIAYSIFIIDDEPTIRDGISLSLESDYQVEGFGSAEAALDTLKNRKPPDLILLDIGLPGMNGIEALRRIRKLYPDILFIMITAYEDIDTVVSAMRLGAYDYIVKPIHMDGLEVTIHNALETIRLRKEVQILQEKYLKENMPFFIGESNAIQDVMALIATVAKSPDTPILILGQTGTGKELIAKSIHCRSPNFQGPFVTVNCAAIPKDLIESELFGYEKGAFSGAKTSGKKGLIEAAANGTLFLDEVGDLSTEAQAKLLRFLEAGEFYHVGGTRKLHVQTRVVSATNKDLDYLIGQNRFRTDLYFRLCVVKIEIPSLNDRREGILPLAKHFLCEFNRKFSRSFTGIAPEAEQALLAHNWTGNVRELKNMIERAVLIGQGQKVTVRALGIEEKGEARAPIQEKPRAGFAPLPPDGIDLYSLQNEMETFYFKEALRMADGNESKAARLLNMNHHTFRYRRRKFKIE